MCSYQPAHQTFTTKVQRDTAFLNTMSQRVISKPMLISSTLSNSHTNSPERHGIPKTQHLSGPPAKTKRIPSTISNSHTTTPERDEAWSQKQTIEKKECPIPMPIPISYTSGFGTDASYKIIRYPVPAPPRLIVTAHSRCIIRWGRRTLNIVRLNNRTH